MKLLKHITFCSLIILFSLYAQAQSCDCTEYLYMNETTNGGAIHKYSLNENFDPATDDASQAIVAEIGNPWFDNTAAGEDVDNPHGLGADLNGFLYIGEDSRSDRGDIRRFNCVGEITDSTVFQIPNEGGYSFTSYNGILYVNTQDFNSATPNYINAYELCTGNLIGFYCMDGFGESRDWGLYINDNGDAYVTSDFNGASASGNVPNNLYQFNVTTTTLNAVGETNPTCVAPFISEGTSAPTVGSNDFARDRIFGVTADNAGNIYVVERTGTGDSDFPGGTAINGSARILKYDSAGNLVSVTPYDIVEGDGGYAKAIGIYYSETLDVLFVSTASPDPNEDCVSLFDTDLNYLGAAIPNPGGGTQAKGINIQSECCPNPAVITIDTLLCNLTYPSDIFLQDFLACDGIICEGGWNADAGNTGIDFNDCDNSIRINGDQACGTFTLFSDGSNALAQCGQFSITLNIETAIIAAATISGDQTICEGDVPTTLTATSPVANLDFQWQMSTTSCTDGFTDIAGATSNTYTPAALSTTTYYRVVTSVTGGCASGSCEETSNCITITTENCCPAQICLPVQVIKN